MSSLAINLVISHSKSEGAMMIDAVLDCRYLLDGKNPLTRAEYEVASKFVRGQSYEDVASGRNVSVETVKSQVSSILSKTETRDRVQLMMLVLEANLQSMPCTFSKDKKPKG